MGISLHTQLCHSLRVHAATVTMVTCKQLATACIVRRKYAWFSMPSQDRAEVADSDGNGDSDCEL